MSNNTLRRKRFIAAFIDCTLMLVSFVILSEIWSSEAAQAADLIELRTAVLIMVSAIFVLFKDVTPFRCSFGKLFLGLRIVLEDGTPPSIKDLIARNISFLLFGGLELRKIRRGELRYGDAWFHTLVVIKPSKDS